MHILFFNATAIEDYLYNLKCVVIIYFKIKLLTKLNFKKFFKNIVTIKQNTESFYQ